MSFIQNLPAIKVYVDNKYLNQEMTGFTEAYLIAVASIPSRPLFFTVHLETGAVWSRLPITAIRSSRYNNLTEFKTTLPLDVAQPYSCLEGNINVIVYEHLRHCQVTVKSIDNVYRNGTYLFTIDVMGQGLSEDPEQYKTHNVIELDTGELVAYPNNMLLFKDEFFTKTDKFPNYRRSNNFYLAGG